MASSRSTKLLSSLVIGAVTLVSGYALGLRGSLQINNSGTVDFRGSDAILSVSGSDLLRIRDVTCTATGGLAKYDTCITANPLSSTGVVVRAQLELGNNPAGGTFDCGFVKAANSATGTTLIENSVSATGANSYYTTGTAHWNGADFIKCGTITPPTSPFTAHLRIWYTDTFGE